MLTRLFGVSRRYYSVPPGFTLSTGKKNSEDHYDLNSKDIADTLNHDPNLRDFYDLQTLQEIDNINNPHNSNEVHDPFDLSDIPVYTNGDVSSMKINENVLNTPYIPTDEPQTMTTEQFMKMMQQENNSSHAAMPSNKLSTMTTDDYLSQMFNNPSTPLDIASSEIPTHPPEPIVPPAPISTEPDLITSFLENDDIPLVNYLPKLIQLKDIINTELPLIVISKLNDPRLNLSIEKYIYDNIPNPKDPVNKFCKRLFLYKNSNCVVLGKNQNIFREINLRLASNLSTPILRRFSGGGTVVHDLGNFNFSFMCSKDDFSRTNFTSELIKNWNSYTNSNPSLNLFELDLNAKGDMVRKSDSKKVSGSAYQIARGKSLHHGTMLLNSNLKNLSKLLKLDPNRKQSIIDRATDSIPSPVVNTNIDPYKFIDLCNQSFVNKFGLPTNLTKKIDKLNYDNLKLIKIGNVESQILKIDDLVDFPDEIMETYNQLKDWNWIFGKTPRFQSEMNLDNNSIYIKFDIDKGRIISIEYDLKDESDARLNNLVNALLNKDNVINFSGISINKYINDSNLQKEIAWNVDQAVNYNHIGVSM